MSQSSPSASAGSSTGSQAALGPRYKWIALSNTTLGVLMATINSSILLISLPDIFRGIHINPLTPSNTSYLLWLILGYLVVTAVLVVSFGRIGDIYGRVRMYNMGFAVFTFFSIMLAVTWFTGTSAALYLVIMRILQGVGGAFLFANSSAILTDAFPENERGLALGINGVAAIAGSFIGLVVGGLLAPIEWRLVFLVSVPFGLFGTVWAYLKLVDTGVRRRQQIDWLGNITFAIGLVSVLIGITYGIEPYGGHTMGWTNPGVLAAIIGGILTLVTFAVIETKVPAPMFRLPLFRIRAFTFGNLASLLASMGRGGLQFILIIWLQGIWLPRHGYSFSQTPLWAGIYLLPLTAGFLIAGPVSGYLSDRYGARPFATGGMIGSAAALALLYFLPINFTYWQFALILVFSGLSSGLFASPNRAGVMNSLPPRERGAGAGMQATFQNSATVLSIGIFFTLIIIGLSSSLPHALFSGLVAHGVPAAAARKVADLPPVGSLFAAFLGYNPVKTLLGPELAHLPKAQVAVLTGRSFFPHLISPAFNKGLGEALLFAVIASLVAAVASALRGGKYIHQEPESAPSPAGALAISAAAPRVGETGEVAAAAAWPAGSPWASTPSDRPAPGGLSTEVSGGPRQPVGGQPVGGQPVGGQPVGGQPVGGQPVGGSSSMPDGLGVAGSGAGGSASSAARRDEPSTETEIAAASTLDPGGRTSSGSGLAAAGSELAGTELTSSELTGSEAEVAEPAGSEPTAVSVAADTGGAEPGAGELAGRVRTVSGRVLAGARVTVTTTAGVEVAHVRTEDDGTYRVPGLEAGSYLVVAVAASCRPGASRVQVAGPLSRLDLAVVGVGSLRGRVRKVTGGAAVDGPVSVSLVPAGGVGRGEAVSVLATGPGGEFVVPSLDEGRYRVEAAAPGFQPASAEVVVEVGRETQVELVVTGAGTVSGVVRVGPDGPPAAGCAVALVDPEGAVTRAGVTGADGSYRFDDVAVGAYTVVAGGFEPVAEPLTLQFGDRRRADLSLGGRRRIVGPLAGRGELAPPLDLADRERVGGNGNGTSSGGVGVTGTRTNGNGWSTAPPGSGPDLRRSGDHRPDPEIDGGRSVAGSEPRTGEFPLDS